MARCQTIAAAFMDGMHARHGFRGKEWDLRTEDEAVLMWIARLALLVSSLRGMNKSTEEDEAETPYRAFNILGKFREKWLFPQWKQGF
jgi:hypothetical protein